MQGKSKTSPKISKTNGIGCTLRGSPKTPKGPYPPNDSLAPLIICPSFPRSKFIQGWGGGGGGSEGLGCDANILFKAHLDCAHL